MSHNPDDIKQPLDHLPPLDERDKAVEIDTYHTGFAVHRPVLSQVVNEIRTFLAEIEGRPPALQPMVVAGPLAKPSRAVRTA